MQNKPWPYPFWIAHRGAGRLAPENTLAAFRLGYQHGYRAFECDVTLSLDGLPFFFHDDTLERTTNGHGAVHAQRWSALQTLDAGSWHSPAFAGEPIPDLPNVARYCLDHGCAVNLELKPGPGQGYATGQVVATAANALWEAHQSAHGAAPLLPLLSSFEASALEGAQQAAPHLPRALLLAQFSETGLDHALRLHCVAIVCHHRSLSANAIDRIHANGMRALAYTVNQKSDAERLQNAGVDGLITDEVQRFKPG
jgi:glycerophosphoryl diester phosphodiesterase